MEVKNINVCIEDNLHDTSSGEYINKELTENDGGYYNTTDVNTAIRLKDLHGVISDKSTGENNTFQSEYKVHVINSNPLQYITISTF